MIIKYNSDRFIKEVLEQEEYGFMFSYPIVIDIGANIGTFSIYIYGKAKEIHAIEPIEENFRNLVDNITDLPKITPYKIAIAGTHGKRKMTIGRASLGGSKFSNKGKTEIECWTLEEFMNKKGIAKADLVKIDVEGAEYEILTAKNFPSDRVNNIIGEFHPNEYHERGFSDHGWDEIKHTLGLMGYRVVEHPSNHFSAHK